MNNKHAMIHERTADLLWCHMRYMCSSKMSTNIWEDLNAFHWEPIQDALNGIVNLNFTR